MNLAIIVPVFNSIFYTRQLIDSIIKEREICKSIDKIYVVIVDNLSTDGTIDFLKSDEYQSKSTTNLIFSHILNIKNYGYGGGANRGIEYIIKNENINECDFLIMNNDMILLPNCIDSLFNTAYSRDNIGIVGGKLLFPDNTIQHGGAFLNVFGWGQHKGGGLREDFYIDCNIVEEQEYVTGALLYIKKEVFDKVGYFDEDFTYGYFEECDLSYRAREHGFVTVYTPNARAIHYENVTAKTIFGDQRDIKKKISDRNQIKFYLKRDEEKKKRWWKEINTEVLEDSNMEHIVSTHDSDYKLLLTSQIYSEWSFCHVMRNLAKGLKRNKVDVSIAPVEYHYDKQSMKDWEIKEMINKPNDYWNRVVLRSCEGDHMYLMPPGKQRIAHTTGENSIVNQDWVLQLNNVDKVLTTSSFFKNVLIDSGIKTPIHILPNSVNLDLFKKEGEKLRIEGLKGLNFVSMFHFGERKAPDILVRAFCKAFTNKDDVTLTIHSLSMKENLERQGIGIRNWISNLVGERNDKPSILVTSTYIEDSLIPSLLRNFDVFVLPTRGEGFGLPPLEAAALEIPSIVTGYSGVLDIVDNNSGWLIDYTLEDIPLQYLPYFQNYIGGKWAKPNEDYLVDLFRYVYNNQEEIKQKGQKSYEKAQNFGINSVGKLAKTLIFEE